MWHERRGDEYFLCAQIESHTRRERFPRDHTINYSARLSGVRPTVFNLINEATIPGNSKDGNRQEVWEIDPEWKDCSLNARLSVTTG